MGPPLRYHASAMMLLHGQRLSHRGRAGDSACNNYVRGGRIGSTDLHSSSDPGDFAEVGYPKMIPGPVPF